MRDLSQTNGCLPPPAKRKPRLSLGGGFRLVWVGLAAWAGLVAAASAQSFRMGPFLLSMTGQGTLGYDSNVDGLYPEEETPGLDRWDFYWMPALSIRSQPAPMSPRIALTLSAAAAYQDYFYRNDQDSEIYNLTLGFQTSHPRISLNGSAGVDYSVDGVANQYVPGGARRDPTLTRRADVSTSWNYRKLRAQAGADYSTELHQDERYQEGDQEEVGLSAGSTWELFKWGGFFYAWDWSETKMIQSGDMDEETSHSFGLSGAVPVELLRRPKITYSFGYGYEEETVEGEEPTKSWDPVHSITVQDEYQLSKTIHLMAIATWQDTWEDNQPSFAWPGEDTGDNDEVTFQYNVQLTQQLGSRAQHSLGFTREPRPTFGSMTETETTTYTYNFGIQDVLIRGLGFTFSASYDTSLPLETEDAVMEKTTTINAGLSHSRQLSRKLSRTLSYRYSWENSNFHEGDGKEQHLATYGLTYAF